MTDNPIGTPGPSARTVSGISGAASGILLRYCSGRPPRETAASPPLLRQTPRRPFAPA